MSPQAREASPPRWVPVLLYHRVVPEPPQHDPFQNFVSTTDFESHLLWLRRAGFRSLPLGSLETIFAGDAQARVPRRSVAITFDDGYEDNHRYAWPLLKRHGFAATIFVVTDAIGESSSFDTAVYPADPMLSADQMREMSRDGITFGSHTCSHPLALTDLSEFELRREVAGSRSALEGVLDAPVTQFAYPHSRQDDRVENAVASAGYRLACGGTGKRFSRYCVTRIPVRGGGPTLAMSMAKRWIRWKARDW
ncbi:MAG TPA: polysaccharide deacetylase family protein [Candidatus Limnocylindrales bacterium]|nr:polysaccharide deacetylase family protein [Candidatus Limnocylindrales bacterium]